MVAIQAFFIFLAAVVSPVRASEDICSTTDTGLSGKELAVTCYVGNFLTKMLGELNSGQNKTAEHVRVHLLPYLGGVATLKALTSDIPDDPECTVCYTNVSTSNGLTGLREMLSESQLASYDSVSVCYARLTDAIMNNLPKSPCGVWLKALPEVNPFKQTLTMLEKIFSVSKRASLCEEPSREMLGDLAGDLAEIAAMHDTM